MMNINPMALAILLFLIFTLWASQVLFKSYFTPLGAYSFSWGVTLFLFHLNLISYPPLQGGAQAAIYGSYLTFFLGTTIAPLVKEKQLRKNRAVFFSPNTNNLRMVMVATAILGAVAAIKRIFFAVALVGFAGMLKGGVRVLIYGFREDIGLSTFWGLLFSLNYIAGLLSGYYLATKSRRNLFCYLPFFSTVAGSLSTAGRTSILFVLLLYFFGYLLGSKKSAPHVKRTNEAKSIIAALLILAIFFSIGTAIWYSRGGFRVIKRDESVYGTRLPLQFMHYYHYLTCSFAAFDRYVSTYRAPHTWGAGLFYPIFHQLEKMGLVEKSPVQGTKLEVVTIPVRANIYSYLRVLYQDFGIAGTILVPFLIGWLTSGLYCSFIIRPDFLKLTLLCYVYIYLLSSSYEYFVYNGGLLFSLGVGLFISLLFLRAPKTNPPFIAMPS